MKGAMLSLIVLLGVALFAACVYQSDPSNPECGPAEVTIENQAPEDVTISISAQGQEFSGAPLRAGETVVAEVPTGTYIVRATGATGTLYFSSMETVVCDQQLSLVVQSEPLPTPTATVVATQQIGQPWRSGVWTGTSVRLADVRAGDAIIVLGIYWVERIKGVAPVPTDDNGVLVAAVDQVPATTAATIPVYAQIFYELNAAAGTHVITPPNLGGTAGDGTLYVIQVRGLGEIVSTGQVRSLGTAIPGVSVGLASEARTNDFVVAIGGYDNTVPLAQPSVIAMPSGWQPLGAQTDAATNVPSEACFKQVAADGREMASWTWSDPTANVTAAAMAAFRPI